MTEVVPYMYYGICAPMCPHRDLYTSYTHTYKHRKGEEEKEKRDDDEERMRRKRRKKMRKRRERGR